MKRYSAEQIVVKLRQADRELAGARGDGSVFIRMSALSDAWRKSRSTTAERLTTSRLLP